MPLQPPLAVVVSSHAANEALMAVWVCPAASVLSAAQLNKTAGAAVTVNRFAHVFVTSHELVYVQVTSTYPPQILGAAVGALFVNTPLHPPLAVVDVLNAAQAASTWACV
jgi:hypothetical protein